VLPIFGIFKIIYNTMSKNTPNAFENHFEQFITNELKSGHYDGENEVIRKALISGEKSGCLEDFSPEEHLKLIHSKHLRKD